MFEKDTDAYARERDAQVMRLAEESGVQVVVRTGRTLYDPDELVEKNGGRPTMSLTQVLHVCIDHCRRRCRRSRRRLMHTLNERIMIIILMM